MRLPELLGPRYDIDFAAARARTAPLAWVLLASGAALFAAALADFLPLWQQRTQLAQQRAALAQTAPSLSASLSRHAASESDLAESRALLGALARPWTPLFDRFEAVDTPKVHLTQVSIDSRFQGMQLLAEAPRLEDVLAFSAKLPGDGPVRSVRLTHHEWRNAPGARVVVANLNAELANANPGGAQR